MNHLNNPISRAKLDLKIDWEHTIQKKSILIIPATQTLEIRVRENHRERISWEANQSNRRENDRGESFVAWE